MALEQAGFGLFYCYSYVMVMETGLVAVAVDVKRRENTAVIMDSVKIGGSGYWYSSSLYAVLQVDQFAYHKIMIAANKYTQM